MTPRQVVEEWVRAPTLALRTVTRYTVMRYRWKADGGASREDEDGAAAAARTGAARVAFRRCRPALAGGATTGGEAGRRPRPGSRARCFEMDRVGLRA